LISSSPCRAGLGADVELDEAAGLGEHGEVRSQVIELELDLVDVATARRRRRRWPVRSSWDRSSSNRQVLVRPLPSDEVRPFARFAPDEFRPFARFVSDEVRPLARLERDPRFERVAISCSSLPWRVVLDRALPTPSGSKLAYAPRVAARPSALRGDRGA
jgi:hypothetical protein